LNFDYTFQLHGNSKGILPYLEFGPALGIYLGGTMWDSTIPKKYIKNFILGCKWGLGMTYYKWRFSPLLELGGINYLTPFYQSENENNFVKRTYNTNTFFLTLGLSYCL
jgi:hypothetical protein